MVSAEALAGVLVAFFAFVMLAGLIAYILTAIGCWKTFTKAGEAGWKGLIPIYNTYTLFDIAGARKEFWMYIGSTFVMGLFQGIVTGLGDDASLIFLLINLIVALVTCVLIIMSMVKFCSKLAKSFGHGTGFAIGLFFLTNIFVLILGLDSSKYVGPQKD